MIVHIPEEPLTKCKGLVQEFQKSQSDFKELGGYLVGIYDGDFTIKEFLLDTNAEATGTRIKLSADCFQQVEQALAKQPAFIYIGTWHVHPGKSKPIYSHTDESTLFLEKLVIKTDNPKEFQCPRIHLIFSEDLSEISAFTMRVELDYHLSDYWKSEKDIGDGDLDRIEKMTEGLQKIKQEFQRYKKNPKVEILDACFSELGEVRDELDQLIDLVETILDFQEILQIIQKNKKKIETQVKSKIHKGQLLGIIILNEKESVDLAEYRPHLITDHQDDGTLLGFWRHFSMEHPPIELQEIFFSNFYNKIQSNANPSYIYVMSDPTGIKFFDLTMTEFTGISFNEVEIAQTEMD
ncbi:MAG: hypothetical protein HWN66_15950 [Candidatus Helarchaeota archaeon]|nr:hypothetical protein [Candidatus Helarchaeota archaeon]